MSRPDPSLRAGLEHLEHALDGLCVLRDKFSLATTAENVPTEVAKIAADWLIQIQWPIDDLRAVADLLRAQPPDLNMELSGGRSPRGRAPASGSLSRFLPMYSSC